MTTTPPPAGFTPGEVGFLEDGTEVLVVAVVGDGAVVENHMCSEDGEADYGYGQRSYVPKVYRTPPVAKLDDQFAAKIAELEAARAELRATRHEITTATAERKALLETLQQVPALRYLDDYISGRITHFVEVMYGRITVRSRNTDSVSKYDSHDDKKGERLLCLFGNSGGDLSWKLNQYRDGSGSWGETFPCRSMDEAKAKVCELLAAKVEAVRTGASPLHMLNSDFTKAADEFGYAIPEDVAARMKDATVAAFTTRVEQARKDLDEASAALAKAGGGT